MKANSLEHAWSKLVETVLSEGKPTSPRNLDTIEIENYTIEYNTPTYVFPNRIRRLNPVFHLVELFYFMDGRSDNLLSKYTRKMDDFINPDTLRFDGSYGPAIYESMPWMAWALTSETATRRAVFPILRQQHVARPFSKDFPCNIALGFRIRENKLNMNVVTRSQDLYRGFLYDTLEFQLLQTLMSSLLNVGIGTYHHTIFSLHLYQQDIEAAQKAAKIYTSEEPMFIKPTIPKFETFQDLWAWCHERCMFAELAVNHSIASEELNLLPDDDIANAILAWQDRTQIIPLGPYTQWVNDWLEK